MNGSLSSSLMLRCGPRLWTASLAAAILLSSVIEPAIACNRGRTGTGTGVGVTRQQMMMMQAMQQQMQRQYQLMLAQNRAEQQALVAKFDSNGDGVISGKERGPAKKLLRDQSLGKAGPLAPPVSSASSIAGKSNRNRK